MNISRYIRKQERFDRIRVIVPRAVYQQALDQLHAQGWITVRAGAYTNKRMFPKCDDSRMLFVMERQV